MSKIDKILTEVYKSNEVKLESQDVNLGAIDDITRQHKLVLDNINKMWKADKVITDAAAKLKAAWSFYSNNKGYGKIVSKNLDTYTKALEKSAKELGIDVKTLPVYKLINEISSMSREWEDGINNMLGSIASINK